MLISENIGKLFFVRLSVKKKKVEKRMNKSQIVNFIAFFKTFQLFWKWGCNSLRIGKSTSELKLFFFLADE